MGRQWPAVLALAAMGIATACLGVWLLVGLFFPALHAEQTRRAQVTCDQRLQRIGRALLQYQRDQGRLPPAYLAGSDGRPAHSWRVLLLPYLGYEGLYARYDLNQPWDSPHNAALTTLMPKVFACPAQPDAAANGETCYMALVGARAGFAGARGRTLDELSDRAAPTILVAELPVAGVTWLDPTDLDADRLRLVINGRAERGIGSRHVRGAHVLLSDGTVRFLTNATPSEELASLISEPAVADGR